MKLMPGFNRSDIASLLLTLSWSLVPVALCGPAYFSPTATDWTLLGQTMPMSVLLVLIVIAVFIAPLHALPYVVPILFFIATPFLLLKKRARFWRDLIRLCSLCLLSPWVLVLYTCGWNGMPTQLPFLWGFYAIAGAFTLSLLAVWITPGPPRAPRPETTAQPGIIPGPLTDGRDLAYERALNLRLSLQTHKEP